jgi:hypothetical protein
MSKLGRYLFLLAALVSITTNAQAQGQATGSSDLDAITNDKTGRYAWIDSLRTELSKGYAAKTCHGRRNRFVFARISDALFRFPREKVDSIVARSLASIEISPGMDRNFYAVDAGCLENPIQAIAITLTLTPLIAVDISNSDLVPSNIDQHTITGGYECSTSDEYDHCLIGVGHSEEWMARNSTARSRSGSSLAYNCGIIPTEACYVRDSLPDGTQFMLSFARKHGFEGMPIGDLRHLYDVGYAAIDQFKIEK